MCTRTVPSARDMNAGEVGCSMTYLRAWRHALERGLSEVVILEDDYVPVRPEAWCLMKEGLQDLRSREVGWDVLYLDSGYWFGDAAGAAAAADLPPHFSRVAFVYASHAILCSERGMRKLLEHNLEACLMPVDEYLPYLNNPAGHPRGPTSPGYTVRTPAWLLNFKRMVSSPKRRVSSFFSAC